MAINKNLLMFFLFLFFPLHVFAENRTVNLIVEYQTVYLAGKPVKA
jgi:hypothetical protein